MEAGRLLAILLLGAAGFFLILMMLGFAGLVAFVLADCGRGPAGYWSWSISAADERAPSHASPDGIDLMVRSLRAGHPLNSAFR